MPYDENGNFVYPLPTRKTKSAVPRPAKVVLPKAPAVQTEAAAKTSGVSSQPTALAKLTEIPPVAQFAPEPEPALFSAPTLAPTQSIQEGQRQLSEMDLALLWNSQRWPASLTLATNDGAALEIVYRGRWSGGFGPDFKGAIIRLNNRLLKGDVELHLRTSDWRAHGHHQDPNYSNVILQVVLEDNCAAAPVADIPVVALWPLFRLAGVSLTETIATVKQSSTRLGAISESAGPCCDSIAERHPDLDELLKQLDRLGQQRFEERATKYEAACSTDADGECEQATQELWAGLLEALGYSQNKTPFRRLANLLPLANLIIFDREARLRRESSEERLLNLETLLLGVAGLLPSHRCLKLSAGGKTSSPATQEEAEDYVATRYSDELERRWQLLARQFQFDNSLPQLTEKAWTFARLRPPNHPARRLAGLARWFGRQNFNEPADLVDKLIAFSEKPAPEVCTAFNDLCRVELVAENSDSDLFWLRRYDFADRAILATMKTKGIAPDLVGTDRAADIVVNVILPFLAAYGRDRYLPTLAKAALAAYQAHPRLAANELVDNVAKQVFGKWLGQPDPAGRPYSVARLINGACRQQGLIFLHRSFCTEQNFEACPLS